MKEVIEAFSNTDFLCPNHLLGNHFARLLGLLVSISCLAFLVATSFDCSMISLLNALHASSDLSMVASNVWAPSSITLYLYF